MQWVKQHIDTADITKPCTGTFTHAMGLPCAHLCAERKKTYGLLPTNFSTHWYWDGSDTVPPLLEPRTIVRKHGRIVHTAPNTDRELSGFERVDQEMAVRSPMRCSGCQGLGHNRRSQQCPVVLQSLIASTDCQLQQSEDFQQQIGGIPVNPPSTCATVLSSQVSVSAFQDSPLFRCLQPVSATENTRNSNIPDLSEPLTPARHLNFPIRHLPTPFTHPTPDQWKLDYLARSKSVREWSPVIAQETTCSEDIATTNQSQPRTPVRQTITALLQLSASQLSHISPFKSFQAENRTDNP